MVSAMSQLFCGDYISINITIFTVVVEGSHKNNRFYGLFM